MWTQTEVYAASCRASVRLCVSSQSSEREANVESVEGGLSPADKPVNITEELAKRNKARNSRNGESSLFNSRVHKIHFMCGLLHEDKLA